MTIKVEMMQEKKAFDSAWKLINNSFNTQEGFPKQVFNTKYSNFLFEEFDWAMTPEFWESAIKPLSIISQDTHVLVAVLDPDPVKYFYHTFCCYNFIKFPTNISGNDYWHSLKIGPKDSRADAMLFNSETVVWLPMSTKWAIWGERSYGTCVLAFENDNTKFSSDNITKTWKSAAFALDCFASINFKNHIVPKEFFDSIMKNYANKYKNCRNLL